MYLQDLNLQVINSATLKMELLNELDSTDIPTEMDIKDALSEMYIQASNAAAPLYYKDVLAARLLKSTLYSPHMAGENLWRKLKREICKNLNEDSTEVEVIDTILEVLSSLIPGGVIIKPLVKKIVKYYLSKGYRGICHAGLT